MLEPTHPYSTPEEYLAREEKAEYKSEYRDGRAYTMAGGSLAHNQMVVTLTIALDQLLEPKPCRVVANDVRLLVEKARLYTYPDVMVVCGKIETDPRQKDTVTNPSLIVEVWSDSTRSFDRGDKFAMYRQIPSLQEYVIIDQTRPLIEHYRREGHFWVLDTIENLGASLELKSLQSAIPLGKIYQKVNWPLENPLEERDQQDNG